MHRTILLAGVLLLSVAACDDPEISSEWANSPIAIDGKGDDWNELSLWYFDDEGISLGVANRADNLYFLLETIDPRLGMSLKRRGFTIWLDPSGEKLKSFGLRILGQDTSAGHLETALLIENILTFVPASGRLGPAVQYSEEHNLSTYEIKVPIKASDSARYHVECKPDGKLSLGFELELPEKMGKPQKRMKKSRMGRGGRMGMGTGSKGMGRMTPQAKPSPDKKSQRPPDKDRKQKPKLEKKEIWLILTLASES